MPPRGTASPWPVRIHHRLRQGQLCAVGWRPRYAACARVSHLQRGAARSAAVALCGHANFCFSPCALPVACGRVHEIDRRPWPALCWRQGEPLQLRSLCRNGSLFELSVRAFGHGLCARAWRSRGLAATGACRMFIYAVVIAFSRLVLLAHHPSDVRGRRHARGWSGAIAYDTGSPAAGWDLPLSEGGKIVSVD